jgi:NAD(P)-dependent dehydrogenase (short-subunit alcohol dehydrogenase family)
VHSAGIQVTRPLQILEPSQVRDVMCVNLEAALQLARGFRQKGVHASSGSIVFVSSVAGLVGQPGIAAYAGSKGGLVAAARCLAVELAAQNVRVNCVAPGHVHTPMAAKLQGTLSAAQFAAIEAMYPLGIGQPEDVAGAVAFLLGGASRWITGTTLVVDGGYTAH